MCVYFEVFEWMCAIIIIIVHMYSSWLMAAEM